MTNKCHGKAPMHKSHELGSQSTGPTHFYVLTHIQETPIYQRN